MAKHILLATDGSELSMKAARLGAELAKALGAKLTAVQVIMPLGEAVSYLAEAERRAEAQARLDLNAVAALARDAGLQCEITVVKDPNPWQGILAAAQERGCDLIVMASHGRRGMAGLLLGSEAQKVLTHSTVPVLISR